jgi:hypothetical protein
MLGRPCRRSLGRYSGLATTHPASIVSTTAGTSGEWRQHRTDGEERNQTHHGEPQAPAIASISQFSQTWRLGRDGQRLEEEGPGGGRSAPEAELSFTNLLAAASPECDGVVPQRSAADGTCRILGA